MNIVRTSSKRSKLIAIVALVVIAAASAISRAKAQVDTVPLVNDRPALFGMMGIARGQTARITVANLHPTSTEPPDPESPPTTFNVVAYFLDSDGNPLLNGDGRPIRRTGMLQAGHSAFLQINADTLLGRDQTRLNFRPVVIVQLTRNADGQSPPDPCVPVVEVIENTSGKTSLLNPGVIRGFNPQPDPPGVPTATGR